MNKENTVSRTHRFQTFVPQLRERRDRIVYEGKLGQIGATSSSRYRLVGLAAVLSLLGFLVAIVIHPLLAALVGTGVVALIAGGWPAATGVAELRQTRRIYSHSIIILCAGLSAVAVTFFEPSNERLTSLPTIAAVGVVASFIAELSRGEGSLGRLESVISCITGVLAAVSVAGWVALADYYRASQSSLLIMGIGVGIALLLGAFGVRLISAGPQDGPRRGAITLGVTPVAFVGVIGYLIAIFIANVVS
ncbi:hypothetical protein [uncultured Rothia sp.]|uniref:hypothetical protein n=1 Tax=uncultured Rothia sp. TaxID=316088 RepID=UPI0032172777